MVVKFILTQKQEISYVQPLLNPKTVDKRRAEVGLPTMDTYLKQSFQMEWSLEKYLKDLPKVEKLL